MADIFDVLADPTRRELLRVLRDQSTPEGRPGAEVSVGGLVDTLQLSQPTVSKHLKVLRDCGLVVVREEGQHRYYRLNPAPLIELDAWLAPFVSGEDPTADVNGSMGADEDAGRTVFAAWSGSSLPAPLRRVAAGIEHSAEAGTAVGRTAAEASHQVKAAIGGAAQAIEGASAALERTVIDPIRHRLGGGDGA